jgi:uncharacterized protein DUF4288
MTWYAAHLVLYVKFKNRRQTRYPVWENIVLIKARTIDEAWDKAEARGREDAIPDDSFTWEGHPAEWVFGGVRKLTECMDEHQRPSDGTEVTYLEMELASKTDLEKFIDGEPVTLRIEDGFPDEEPVARTAVASNGR